MLLILMVRGVRTINTFTVWSIVMSCKETLRRDSSNPESKEKVTHRRSFIKLTISLFLLFHVFALWPWKLWPQLAGKYVSFGFAVSV